MAEDPDEVVWVRSQSGVLRGFHNACAKWLGLPSQPGERQASHTEICRGCARFLLTPAADHGHSKPLIDPKELLK